MQHREFNIKTETKPSLSRQVLERQKDEHEARDARLPQSGPFAPLISGIGDASSADVHASMLNRATNGRPSHAGQSLLQLQKQYGNCYVQRVLALAGKGIGEAEAAPEVEESIQQARGGGHGIDSRVRGQMESAFGADFGNVRLHTDTQADTLNRELSASAFTTGQDIFFRQGAYNPSSSSGRELIAHELTHVVQQNGNKVKRKLSVGRIGDRYEEEADQVARAVMQHEKQYMLIKAGVGQVSKQVKEEEGEEEIVQTKVISNIISMAPIFIQRECDIDHVDATRNQGDFGSFIWTGREGFCSGLLTGCVNGPQPMGSYQHWDPFGGGDYTRTPMSNRHIVGTVNHPTSRDCFIDHESWVTWVTITEHDVWGDDYSLVVLFEYRDHQRGSGCNERTEEGFEFKCEEKSNGSQGGMSEALGVVGSIASIAGLVVAIAVPGVPPPP